MRWELISRNPVLNATLPKEEHKERDIWTAETLSKAMEVCDDPILSLALNLAFSCSLRIGEMLGLTWDCIDIAPQSIENGSAYIFVNKELQRVTPVSYTHLGFHIHLDDLYGINAVGKSILIRKEEQSKP